MDESVVEEMELQYVTTADSSDGSVIGTEGNTAVNQSLQSVYQETDTHAVSNSEPFQLAHVMGSQDSSDRDGKLLAALQQNEYDIFIENLDPRNPNPSYDEPYNSSLLEIACQTKNRKRFVEHLLENGADPNTTNPVTGKPLLHATANSVNVDVLEILLERVDIDIGLRDNTEQTILHWWASVSERNQGDKESLENFFKIFLQSDFGQRLGIDCKDKYGKTPFCIALECDNWDKLLLLFGNGGDVMVRESVRHVLESCSSSKLEVLLDYCVESNGKPLGSEDLEVKLRYDILKRILFLAEVPHHADIVRHPAFSVFLSLTWGKRIRPYFVAYLFYYFMFLSFLTADILYSHSAATPSYKNASNSTNGLFSVNDSRMTSGMNDEMWDNTKLALQSMLMILMGLHALVSSFFAVTLPTYFFKHMELWLKLPLFYITSILISGTVDSNETKRHLFAFFILWVWYDLVRLLGRLPELSVQTVMFKTVRWTFVMVMVGYIFLILAFAFSFYILFKEEIKVDGAVLFNNPWTSIVKTFAMFAGELEFSYLPFDKSPGTSHVIFMLFVFLIAIVLLNLFNGLAVDDTKKIRKKAETLSLVASAKITSYVLYVSHKVNKTRWLPKRFPLRYVLREEMFVLYPNKPNKILPSDLESLRRIITKKREVSKKVKWMENVQNCSCLAELTELRLKFDKMQEILIKILNK